MNRRDLVLAACGALAAAPAAARQRPYRFDGDGDPRLLRLSSRATAVKVQGAALADALVTRGLITPQARASLDMAGFSPRAAGALLGFFFASSQIVVGHIESATPIVGYYSPTLDLWWLTLWAVDGPVPVLTHAKVLAGGALAAAGQGPPPSPAPRWVDDLRRRTVIEALSHGARTAYGEFRAEFALDTGEPPSFYHHLNPRPAERGLLRGRTGAFATNIAAFAETQHGYDVHDATLRGLGQTPAVEPPEGLSPEARAGFSTIAQASRLLRERLAPVAAIRLRTTWFVVSANPGSGRFLLLAAVDTAASAPLQRLTLMDVMAGPERRA